VPATPSQLGLVAHQFRRTLDDDVKTVEAVTARRDDALGVLYEVLRLAFGRPVQKYNAPSSQTPTSGVTCGRPLGRTVDNQYTLAFRSASRAYAHSVGTASIALKEPSSTDGSCSTNSRAFIFIPIG
jgi:hypothetical protein